MPGVMVKQVGESQPPLRWNRVDDNFDRVGEWTADLVNTLTQSTGQHISQVADCIYSHVVSSEQYKRLAGRLRWIN